MAPSPTDRPQRFPFAIDGTYRLPARAFGVHHGTAWVEVGEHTLEARFGPWRVRTPLSNIAGVETSGPYALARTIGPAHLSFADRGLTFATNGDRGVCLRFTEPVTGIDPLGLLRHPGLTVTVADPDGLAALLRGDGARNDDLEEEREEQAAEDHLHTMTAAELRALADERGIAHASSLKKADLVELLETDLGDDLVEELAPER
ncbi:Rho termination factor N-terminal domain-containing protein [Aquihabitans sp. G128]|uniref:Rho termination factor N-terminal domain-containing protein n=1 Tax=Aquihabitans sp. G128 TaxID=2849779 RepID=UPI001C2300EC|nr:Rho termination factor N-terminal domain-containing protein [Aquihabitans sp. G128]QXC60007.1 Rho termination factor N-terminal domain-containing protein [Aquihabitans sp. G128]